MVVLGNFAILTYCTVITSGCHKSNTLHLTNFLLPLDDLYYFLTVVLTVMRIIFLFFGGSGDLVGPPSGAIPLRIAVVHFPVLSSHRHTPPQSSVKGMHWALQSTLSHRPSSPASLRETHDLEWQQLDGTQSESMLHSDAPTSWLDTDNSIAITIKSLICCLLVLL